MIRTRHQVALLLGTLALVLVPLASATTASAATVELRKTELGEVLVDSQGFTLFRFSLDVKKMDRCVAINECRSVWPPLTVTATETPTVGPGLNAKKLKTIMLPDGERQVMYSNHPLYGYTGSTGPGQTSYVGAFEFGGYWYATNAKGAKVR